MARVEETVRGLVRAEISGPEPEKLLNACLAENLPRGKPAADPAAERGPLDAAPRRL